MSREKLVNEILVSKRMLKDSFTARVSQNDCVVDAGGYLYKFARPVLVNAYSYAAANVNQMQFELESKIVIDNEAMLLADAIRTNSLEDFDMYLVVQYADIEKIR